MIEREESLYKITPENGEFPPDVITVQWVDHTIPQGLVGNTYNLPCLEDGEIKPPVSTSKAIIKQFLEFAENNHQLMFYVTKAPKLDLSNLGTEKFILYFYFALDRDNVFLPREYERIIVEVHLKEFIPTEKSASNLLDYLMIPFANRSEASFEYEIYGAKHPVPFYISWECADYAHIFDNAQAYADYRSHKATWFPNTTPHGWYFINAFYYQIIRSLRKDKAKFKAFKNDVGFFRYLVIRGTIVWCLHMETLFHPVKMVF